MKTSAVTSLSRLFTLGTLVSALCAVSLTLRAAVSACGLVFVGHADNNDDNGTSSSDGVLALLHSL